MFIPLGVLRTRLKWMTEIKAIEEGIAQDGEDAEVGEEREPSLFPV